MLNNDSGTLLAIGAAAVGLWLMSNQKDQQSLAIPSPVVEPTGNTETDTLGDISSLSNSTWFDAGQYVKIMIPFEQRMFAVNSRTGNVMEVRFLYRNHWMNFQTLFRYWNPIRSLPSWMR
jgi:hypothetical protein